MGISEYSSDGGSDSGSDHGLDDGKQDSPMMSIFASYYGIEEPESGTKLKGTIDDANFEPDEYVKQVLVNETVEGLVAKDAEMVHEIRTLDGEMQKLVYDNYNKFITATETIKEMKNDVFGMDSDMDSVRLKMAQIAKSSEDLDEVLQDKRTQVDKLVRVRRLLHRLEFLSELPERLAEMIDRKQYKEAVQLYNKTISVLTRHSHVLSFKNIKERTELMMKDLTGKVILMLDDVTLEDVKLTQYVTVLRLMNAPRMKVMEKLLHAHKHRSLRMITAFNAQLTKSTVDVTSSTDISAASTMTSASNLVLEMLNDISNARKFAQSLVVGLIEACKGIYDLFQLHQTPSSPSSATSASTADRVVSPSLDLTHDKDARHAYSELKTMISHVMAEYTKSMTAAFKQFFTRYNAHFLSVEIDYADYDETERASVSEQRQSASSAGAGSSNADDTQDSEHHPRHSTGSHSSTGDRNPKEVTINTADESVDEAAVQAQQVAKFKSSELQEERGNWLLLARQAINDVIYLDSTQFECKNNCNFPADHASCSASVDGDKDGHAKSFADAILHSLVAHCDVLQNHRIACYLTSVVSILPQVQLLVNVKATSGSAGNTPKSATDRESHVEVTRPRLGGRASTVNTSGSLHSMDAQIDRQGLQKNTIAVKKLLDTALNHAVVSFAESVKDIKGVVDIFEASRRDPEQVVATLVSKHFNRLADSVERLCGVVNHKVKYDNTTNTLTYLQGGGGSAVGESADGEVLPEDADEIYSETTEGGKKSYKDATKDSLYDMKVSADSAVSIKHTNFMLFGSVLRRLLPVFISEVNATLTDNELPAVDEYGAVKTQCDERLDLTYQLLLQSFLETNASHCAALLSASQHEIFIASYGTGHSDPEAVKSISVSGRVLDISQYLDTLTVLSCLLMTESPPALKMAAMDRDLMRRGGARQSIVAGGHHSLQLDIERLFSQRIKVFDKVTSAINLDFVLSTVIKAALKATQEAVRFMVLTPEAYIHIQANITFIKQVTSCLVKDVTDCDNLVDQILSAVFSRYIDANDIANAADGNEVAVISKAVTDAFGKLSDKTVLLTRT